MALAPGTRLGVFEVTAQIGVGGMGEVYRARDTRLKREVAIKVLPEAFSQDPDRMARFQREAEVLASLNHPHIAAIYGIEEGPAAAFAANAASAPGALDSARAKEAGHYVRALIMELVEGPTLAGRIAQGAIPLEDALPIARQIAVALEAAHEQGIVHRDLKPANIKITPDGVVKVLDFGLAKLTGPAEAGHYVRGAPGGADVTASPTITTPAMLTGIGMILGTAAYMSPEQAKGREADKRSDIWAFGCVLFEMLTGKRAFEGEDVSDTLAGSAQFSTAGDGSLAYIAGNADPNRMLVWLDRAGKATAALETRSGFQSPRLSPDGKRVVVSVQDDGSGLGLWAYEFERGTRQRLTTSGTNRRTVWSPDGSQVAFYSLPQREADQDLYVMPSTGGEPRKLLERPGSQYPDAWSPDGRSIVFEEHEGGGTTGSRDLWLLPIGEAPRPLVVTRFYERGAVLSPDGRWLAFVTDEPGRPEVYVQPFPGPGPKVTISNNGGLQPMWSRDGRELFYREGDAMMAVSIQLDPFRVEAPRKLFEFPRTTYNFDQNFADYDLAPDGRFLAIRADTAAVDEIHVVLNWTEELRRALGR